MAAGRWLEYGCFAIAIGQFAIRPDFFSGLFRARAGKRWHRTQG